MFSDVIEIRKNIISLEASNFVLENIGFGIFTSNYLTTSKNNKRYTIQSTFNFKKLWNFLIMISTQLHRSKMN